MYEMVIVNQFGKVSVIKSYNLEELKKVAQRLNGNGCDVEIIEKKVIYRIVQMNNYNYNSRSGTIEN